MLEVFVNLAGILLIAFILWWFWLANSSLKKQAKQGEAIEVIVDGGVYVPDTIVAKAGDEVMLSFLRKDSSPCSETVVFAELNQSKDLPINEKTMVTLRVEEPGIYEFTCPMGMYRGKLKIE